MHFFLDAEKAYDIIDKYGIIKILLEHNIIGHI